MNPRLAVSAPLSPPALAAVPGLRVRPVAREDAPRLIALCQEHAQALALERRPFGPPREDPLELMEVLFEPPFGAWAWLAEVDDQAIGYASATAGFSMLERAYCLHLDDPYLRAPWQGRGVEVELLRQALAAARRFGCLNLQCQSPAWHEAAQRLDEPVRTVRPETARHVLPLA